MPAICNEKVRLLLRIALQENHHDRIRLPKKGGDASLNSIATNIDAIAIRNNLNFANNTLARTLERMSSGLKLRHAKDDAAGVVISSKTNLKINGLKIANNNIQFSLSLLNTANDAYSNITNVLTRLRDLSLQAANSTYDDESRSAMQDEANGLTGELERIKTTTKFNNLSLFNYQPTENEVAENQQLQSNVAQTSNMQDNDKQIPAMMSMRAFSLNSNSSKQNDENKLNS